MADKPSKEPKKSKGKGDKAEKPAKSKLATKAAHERNDQFDVLIIGDEVESILTAVSAARAGAKVALLRRSYGRLGGLSVRGGLSYMDITVEFATGLFREFLTRAGVIRVALNPERAHRVLADMLREDNVSIFSGVEAVVELDEQGYPGVINCERITDFWQEALTGPDALSPYGETADEAFQLDAKVVIDATPDADCMRALGVPYTVGLGEVLGEHQDFLGISPVFRILGVTVAELRGFEESLRQRDDIAETLCNALKYHPKEMRDEFILRPTFAPDDQDYLDILNPTIGVYYHQWRHGRVDDYADAGIFIDGANIARLSDGTLGFNGLVARPHALGLELEDLLAMSQGGAIPEELLDEMTHFERWLREVGGFAGVSILPPQEMYVRQTVNLLALETMTAIKTIMGGVPADRAIASFSYWLDMRGTQLWQLYPGEHLPKPVFNIGLGVALPPNDFMDPPLHNIAFVSRSAGFSPLAQGTGRIVQHNSLLGEGLGIAAALACSKQVPLHEIAWAHVAEIQEVLRGRWGELKLAGQPTLDMAGIAASKLLEEDRKVVVRLREQAAGLAGIDLSESQAAGEATGPVPNFLLDSSQQAFSNREGAPTMDNQGQGGVQSVQLKRQVTVKTLVTDVFRERAKGELDNELKLIETQSQQLEAQYQHSMQQLEKVAQEGQNVQKQLQQLNGEVQQRRSQLGSVKIQVSTELGNLDKVENGQYIVTGLLESFVEVKLGDNIYERLLNAEMLVEDGIVKSIR